MLYTNFLGIDISKSSFVVAVHGQNQSKEYQNTIAGISQFIVDNQQILQDSLSIIEPTGGYEVLLIDTLIAQGFKVHRVHTRKVKSFIRSFGNEAKTDNLDSKALAKYGFERQDHLELFQPTTELDKELLQLIQRRSDLKSMLLAEKNRLQNPSLKPVKASVAKIIAVLKQELEEIWAQIEQIISSDQQLSARIEILKTIPGIGNIVAVELLTLLPELGKLCRRKIASLAGLAPKSNDSGKFKGYRKTANGRNIVKPVLFLAAMAARNSKTNLKEFYERLILKGKKKMVALTALMRKILVIANAKLKYANII